MGRGLPRTLGRALALCGLAILALVARAAHAVELLDGRVSIHGYGEVQLRAISDGLRADGFYWSQWANILNVESDLELAPSGFGPFDRVRGFVRLQVRYDCVWTRMCGLAPSYDYFGDRAHRVPPSLGDGTSSGYSGVVRIGDPQSADPGGRLQPFEAVPPLRELLALGQTNFDATLAPVASASFGLKKYGGTLGPLLLPTGPWLPKTKIVSNGALASVPSSTGLDLPLRPHVPDVSSESGGAHGLYVPSTALRQRLGEFDDPGVNLSQNELAWNHRESEDEHELKEAYLDAELFDGRLFLRLGKQTIVWGKTEIFRGVDQFNPQNLTLASLPDLDESRIPLWAARAIYSLYDVGPLEDVRLELAANLDDFEFVEVGTCHEPYSPFLVCGATSGLFTHGTLGVAIAGVQRPPAAWNSIRGVEAGGRVEWRWRRFSFALTDFWGYSDFPYIDYFNEYQRKVDVQTGQPLDVEGNLLDPASPGVRKRALEANAANRQFFDVFCSGTVGLAANVFPALDKACLLDLINDQTPILAGISPAPALAAILTGTSTGPINAQFLLNQVVGTTGVVYPLTRLNVDPNDGPPSPPFPATSLSRFLTPQQEALLGCGAFYGTSCDRDGADLFNTEASVLLQAFPQFEPGGPVATRFVNGKSLVLPGARGPGDAGYSVLVDGSPPPGFHSEMQALSKNFLTLLAYLGAANDPGCRPANPITCVFVQGLFAATGVQRPELRSGGNGRFGRRDFLWQSGSELAVRFHKRNVLGFALDFAEDTTKTNWNIESTWIAGEPWARTDVARGYGFEDTFNVAISVDRPTFVNFLNANRTFLFNSQWFFRYIDGWRSGARFDANGPVNVLATLTATTGYFQDRLLPSLTLVHDFNSISGAVLPEVAYRFNANFSATFGVSVFYGDPKKSRLPVRQAVLQNNGGDFRPPTRFEGVSALAERDEIFLLLRHTF